MKNMHACIPAVALILLISSACSSLSQTITYPVLLRQEPTPAQPALTASQFPRGRFSAVSMPNMVVLTIENDGHFRIFLDNDLLDSGIFEVNGSQVRVNSLACAAQGDKAATYSWLYDVEDGLAFQSVATDPCAERQQYLSEEYMPKYVFVFDLPDRGPSREWLW